MELRGFSNFGLAREVTGPRPWLLALAALTILRLTLCALLPLSPDEAYYWLWSGHLQAGYFDHPPMVALWIRIGTLLLGHSALGVRLLGPLAAAAGSVLLWDAAEHMFPGRRAGLVAASLFNVTLIVNAGAVLMTPDTPLLFFETAMLAALGRWLSSRNGAWWLALGVAAGAALLSKYTALLLVAAIGLCLLSRTQGRAALRTPWPWAGLALALAVFAPNLAWNAAHDFVSYAKQGGREAQFFNQRAAQFLVEFVVGQFALATPLVFGLVVGGTVRLWRAPVAAPAEVPAEVPAEASAFLLWLVLLPTLVFAQHALSGRVQANWPAIIFLPGCLAASALAKPVLARWWRPALGVGMVFSLTVYAQALMGFVKLPPKANPITLQLAGWPGFARQVLAMPAVFYTSEDYTTLAELVWLAPPGTRFVAIGARWKYLSLPPVVVPPGGVAVSRNRDETCPRLTGMIERTKGKSPVMRYYVCSVPTSGPGFELAAP